MFSKSKQRRMKFTAWVILSVMVLCLGVPTNVVNAQSNLSLNSTSEQSGLLISDIENHWANEQISELVSKDIVKGYPDGTFKPNNNIKRAEFAALTNKAFNFNETISIDFVDVNSSDWFYAEIGKAKKAGYLSGYSDKTVKPNNPISRQEVAAIIAKIKGLESDEDFANNFSDSSTIPQWSKGFVGAVVKAGYMNGYPDGTFKGTKSISRAEAVVSINNSLDEIKEIGETVKLTIEDIGNRSVNVGKITEVTVNTNLEDAKITAVSSDEKIGKVTVDKNKITIEGKAVGSAQITVTAAKDGYESTEKTFTVNVTKKSSGGGSSSGGSSTISYNQAGTYGPETGTQVINNNVAINVEGVTLRNMNITGNLVLGAGIGEGDVTLEGVTVNGTTTVNGGGANSIHFKDSVLLTVIVNKNNGSVRIVAEGSTSVQEVQLQSSATVQEDGLTGNATGFTDVTLSEDMAPNSDVKLLGSIETVNTKASNVRITLGENADIESIILNAVSQVVGEGVIRRATINSSANGSTMASMPTEVLNINEGATVIVDDEDYDDSYNFVKTTTLTGMEITQASATLDFEHNEILGVKIEDFVVTATLDGQVHELENLEYDSRYNRITFSPVPLTNNMDKTFEVTVTPAEDSDKIGGEGKIDSVTVKSGFEGRITDIRGVGVEGMEIKFRVGITNEQGDVVATATTEEDGYYSVQIDPGVYLGELNKEGFVTTYIVATSLSDVYNVGQNGTAIEAASEDEVKIVLSWGEHPWDLDSHLVGPTPEDDEFHTAFYNRTYSYGNEVYVDLDWDDVNSYGPETTTIRQLVDGKYTFYVHHFYGEKTIRTSGARIEVYKGSELLKTYNAPTGSGTEEYWIAFDMVVDGDSIEFIKLDEMINEDPMKETSLAPLVEDITIFNNQGDTDMVEITGLSQWDIVKLYNSLEATEPFETSVQVQPGDDTIVFENLDLGVEPGSIWVSVTSTDMYESSRVEKEFLAETEEETVTFAVYARDDYDNLLDDVWIMLTKDGIEEDQITDNGIAEFELPEGEYSLEVEKYGYTLVGPNSINVTENSTTFDITLLEVEEPSVGETVVEAVYTTYNYEEIYSYTKLDIDSEDRFELNYEMEYLVVTFSDDTDDMLDVEDFFGNEITVTNTVYGDVYSDSTVANSVYDKNYLWIDPWDLNLVSGENKITVTSDVYSDRTVTFTVYKQY